VNMRALAAKPPLHLLRDCDIWGDVSLIEDRADYKWLREETGARRRLGVQLSANKGRTELLMCRFLGHRHDGGIGLLRPMFEKRQGTKSREVGLRPCRKLYGDCARAPARMVWAAPPPGPREQAGARPLCGMGGSIGSAEAVLRVLGHVDDTMTDEQDRRRPRASVTESR